MFEVHEPVRSGLVRRRMRASHLTSQREAYLLCVDIAMGLHRQDPSAGYAALALEASESARTASTGIRQATPACEAVVQPRPLSVPAIQQLLDEDTVLVEYSLGRDHGYAWTVTPSSLRSYELPSPDEIDTAARDASALVTARSTLKQGEPFWQTEERMAKADRQMPAAILALSRLVIAPLEADLHHKRIVVVADGALRHVPFAMLTRSGATAAYRPLIADAEVVSVPSASAIAVRS